VNAAADKILDKLLVQMIGQNIPRYEQLRERLPGIDDVMIASPDKYIQFWYRSCRMDWWAEYVVTVGEFRERLEKCTYTDGYPGWICVLPWEKDCQGVWYQGIYDGGTDYYRVNIMELDYCI
jgi:hypothetical protein